MANESSNRQGQGGGGGAENQGGTRADQKAPLVQAGKDEKKDIANQTGLKPEDIINVQQTGALSGRGDAAGGSGDEMTGTNTEDATDKF